MRTIVNNPYHLWANEVQSYAANQSRNRSFEGTDAYSYRTIVARIVRNKKGAKAFILTTRSYSVTTAKHMSEIRHAIGYGSGATVFNIDNVGSKYTANDDKTWHAGNVQSYLTDIAALALKVKRARSNKEWREAALYRRVEELREYVKFFGLRTRIPENGVVDDLVTKLEKIQAAERAQERKEAERVRKAAQENIEKWKAGDPYARIPYSIREAYMRITSDGQTVQTSHGADAPIDHVRKAMPLVLRMIRAGGTYNRLHSDSEIRLGHYTLNTIDAQGNVTVGCHYFTRSEVERFAAVLATAPVPTS